MASGTLRDMDDHFATVIPFPLHRVTGAPPAPCPAPDDAAQYWALVQRLAAERRRLEKGAG